MHMTRQNIIGLSYYISGDDKSTTIELADPKTVPHNAKSITVNASFDSINQSWYNWQNGGQLIQKAFSYLNADEREFLMTGITSSEWDELFPVEEDNLEDNESEA